LVRNRRLCGRKLMRSRQPDCSCDLCSLSIISVAFYLLSQDWFLFAFLVLNRQLSRHCQISQATTKRKYDILYLEAAIFVTPYSTYSDLFSNTSPSIRRSIARRIRAHIPLRVLAMIPHKRYSLGRIILYSISSSFPLHLDSPNSH
jgi:hypothetical protein